MRIRVEEFRTDNQNIEAFKLEAWLQSCFDFWNEEHHVRLVSVVRSDIEDSIGMLGIGNRKLVTPRWLAVFELEHK